jgi:hypothetical protein
MLSSPESLSVALITRDGLVADLALGPRRFVEAASSLEALPYAEALARVPRIFALCRHAQNVCAIRAVEHAFGASASSAAELVRDVGVLLERAESHALALFVDLPSAMGLPPDLSVLQRLRGRTAELWQTLGRSALMPFAPEPDDRAPARTCFALVRQLETVTEQILPRAATASAAAWRAWIEGDRSPLALALRQALPITQTLGDVEARGLSTVDERDVVRFLRSAEVAELKRPMLAGRVRETGAWARCQTHPLVTGVTAELGRAMARLAARMLELVESPSAIAHRLDTPVGPHAMPEAPRTPSGHGLAVVECARGLLAHDVTVASGQIARWRILAPTEWNFHPDGVFRESLVGSPALGAAARARVLGASLDPCVPLRVEVEHA